MKVYNLLHSFSQKKKDLIEDCPDFLKKNPFLKVAHLLDKKESNELE